MGLRANIRGPETAANALVLQIARNIVPNLGRDVTEQCGDRGADVNDQEFHTLPPVQGAQCREGRLCGQLSGEIPHEWD